MRQNTFCLKQDQLLPVAQPSYVEKHASRIFCSHAIKKMNRQRINMAMQQTYTFAHILAFF